MNLQIVIFLSCAATLVCGQSNCPSYAPLTYVGDTGQPSIGWQHGANPTVFIVDPNGNDLSTAANQILFSGSTWRERTGSGVYFSIAIVTSSNDPAIQNAVPPFAVVQRGDAQRAAQRPVDNSNSLMPVIQINAVTRASGEHSKRSGESKRRVR